MTASSFSESDFNPLAPEFDADPFPTYRRLREQGLYRWEAAGAWVVTRFDQYVEILRDTENFSPDRRFWEHYEEPADIGMPPRVQAMMENNLFSMEGREHSRLRRLVSQGFTPRAVAQTEPEVVRICNERIDGFIEKGEVELAVNLGLGREVSSEGLTFADHRCLEGRQQMKMVPTRQGAPRRAG